MNVSTLQPPSESQLHRISTEAVEQNADDFLALRLLSKRARIRLSPIPFSLDAIPAQGRLFSVANTRGWFAAAIQTATGFSVICSPLQDLRTAFSKSNDGEVSFEPLCKNSLPDVPVTLTFADNDSRLVIAFAQGSIIVYDTEDAFSTNAQSLSPCQSITGPPDSLLDICPNPGGIPELVAILRQLPPDSDSLAVEIRDVRSLQCTGGWRRGDALNTTPAALSWSAKGKQLAIGLHSGDIVTYAPTDTSERKATIPRPSTANGLRILSFTWLSNNEFHVIYGPPGSSAPDVEQTHLILVFDPKTNSLQDIRLLTPYLPFPGIRPPGAFTLTFRNWGCSKFLLFVGDSTSSDIGLIGSTVDASSTTATWCNFSLEETSTPSVPLDKDMNDTVLLGLAQDLTASKPLQYAGASGETTELPPSPVMFLYASDGTVMGWNVMNTSGVPYPGMSSLRETADSGARSNIPAETTPAVTIPVDDSMPIVSSISDSKGLVLDTSSTATSDHSPAAPRFPPDGLSRAEEAAIDVDVSVARSSPPLVSPTASDGVMESDSESDTDADLDVDVDADADFGDLSLAERNDTSTTVRANSRAGGMFAPSTSPLVQTATAASTGNTFSSTSVFGSGPVRPAAGFGAFGNTGTSAFSKPMGSTTNSFDSASWASAIADSKTGSSAFSKSAFGQSAFGQSSFGQSSVGQTTTFGQAATNPGESKATSAFGQFASQPSAFAQYASKPSVFGQSATQKILAEQASAWPSPSTAVLAKSNPDVLSFGQATVSTPSVEVVPPSRQNEPVLASSHPHVSKQESVPKSEVSTGFGTPSLSASSQAIAPAFGNITVKPSAFSTPSFGLPSFRKSSSEQGVDETPPSNNANMPALGQAVTVQPAFGQSTFGQPSVIPRNDSNPKASSAFGSYSSGPSAFGVASVKQSVFGKSSFGETSSNTPSKDISGGSSAQYSTFGQTSFGQVPVSKAPSISTGGFGAFAASPVTFGSLAGAASDKPAWSTSTAVKTELSAFPMSALTTPLASSEGRVKEGDLLNSKNGLSHHITTESAVSRSSGDEPHDGLTAGPVLGPSADRSRSEQLSDQSKKVSSALPVKRADDVTFQSMQLKTPPPLPALDRAAPPVPPPFSLRPSADTISKVPGDSMVTRKSPEKLTSSSSATHVSSFSSRPLVPSPLSNFSVPSSAFSLAADSQPRPTTPLPVNGEEQKLASLSLPQRLSDTTIGRIDTSKSTPRPSLQIGEQQASSSTIQDGMQAECARLYTALSTDLNQLHQLAEESVLQRKAHYETSSSEHKTNDLALHITWHVSDVKQFHSILQGLEGRLSRVHERMLAHRANIRDLESSLLKANTRKEEITRFGAASKDTELSKVLESRSLGPEHTEAQSQLRRDIRIIRERLQQLEDHIQASKKVLTQMQGGRTTFRPPSLDTINRTYRNIEIAIDQHESAIHQLAAEVSSMSLKAGARLSSKDRGLPEQYSKPSGHPTPHIAVSTAAALNAEMSAQKLKHALLTGRKEPLLNTQAVVPPLLENDAASTTHKPLESAWFNPGGADSNFEPSLGPGLSRHRGAGGKQHAKPIPLKKSTQPASTTPPPAGFSWGPLPSIAPMKTLSADLRQSVSSQSASP